MWFASKVFAFAVGVKNFLYDSGIFSSYKSSVLVVSIGNVIAGGSGKTPLTIMLANNFSRAAKVAVILRGYHSRVEKSKGSVLFQWENSEQYTSQKFGDEACVISRNCPRAVVIVGKDKVSSIKIAEELGVDIAIIDDGMQHRRLGRDFDFLTIDPWRPFGCKNFIPYGLLRDSISRIVAMDKIFIAKANMVNNCKSIEDEVRRMGYHKSISSLNIGIKSIHDAHTDLVIDEKEIYGQNVGIFCALGNPFQFRSFLEKFLKVHVVDSLFGVDHEDFSLQVLRNFHKRCRALNAKLSICSEKDFVKLGRQDIANFPLAYVKIHFYS